MTQEDYKHPIAPPPELVRQWCAEADNQLIGPYYDHIATRAAQWGADQELEACCGWVHRYASLGKELRAARRPKPPSLKEQAKHALETLNQTWTTPKELDAVITIRRALEQLPDNE
jgi:hypothetical protein